MLCSLNLHHFSLHQSLIFELLKEEEKKLGEVWTASIGTINQTINKIRKREIKIVWLNFEKENIKMFLRKKQQKCLRLRLWIGKKSPPKIILQTEFSLMKKRTFSFFFYKKPTKFKKSSTKMEWLSEEKIQKYINFLFLKSFFFSILFFEENSSQCKESTWNFMHAFFFLCYRFRIVWLCALPNESVGNSVHLLSFLHAEKRLIAVIF